MMWFEKWKFHQMHGVCKEYWNKSQSRTHQRLADAREILDDDGNIGKQ